MSVTTPASALSEPSRIDEQLRLRITEDLSGTFKGDIIGPDHADYERARLVWNAMVDRRPGLILRCTSTQDVVVAVNVAREQEYADSMTGDYLKAVAATLNAMRRIAEGASAVSA